MQNPSRESTSAQRVVYVNLLALSDNIITLLDHNIETLIESFAMCSADVGDTSIEYQYLVYQWKERLKEFRLLAILGISKVPGIKDCKSLWAADKSMVWCSQVESKKMQKNVLLLKFMVLLVSNEDANIIFLRALHLSWSNIALIMKNKACIDELDINDLYNNLKVFEAGIKGSFASSSNSQNVAFLSTEDTSSTNEVNTISGIATASGQNSQGHASSSYIDDLMFSFFASQSSSPQLNDDDLEQINHDDLEEMDLKWQVAMLFMWFKQFYKKTGRKLNFNSKEPVGFDKTKVECYNCQRRGHFIRECRSRSQANKNGDAGYRNRENTRRNVLEETFDW
ncbi:ribonuclease H-like domain-containing protein [Tanacetum coccineum]